MGALSNRTLAMQRVLVAFMIASMLLAGLAFLEPNPVQAEYCQWRESGKTECRSGELYKEICWFCYMFGQWVNQGSCYWVEAQACCI